MSKRSLLFAVTLLIASSIPSAQTSDEPLWNRYPAISPDGSQIAFTYKGDLYLVPSSGGTARPLTMHEAHDFMPVWSPDGTQIAFASDRYGNFDIFIMSAKGGEPRRLTHHSAPESPFTFAPDGQSIVFGAARQDTAEHRGFPTGYMPELYRVPVAGGEPVLITDEGEQLLRTGEFAAFPKNCPDGHHLVNRSTQTAVYLEIGSRHPNDRCHYPDIDLHWDGATGAYTHKDGTAYP